MQWKLCNKQKLFYTYIEINIVNVVWKFNDISKQQQQYDLYYYYYYYYYCLTKCLCVFLTLDDKQIWSKHLEQKLKKHAIIAGEVPKLKK